MSNKRNKSSAINIKLAPTDENLPAPVLLSPATRGSTSAVSPRKIALVAPMIPFQMTYPDGVALSTETVSLLSNKSKKRKAITFDEVTLSDQSVEFHPNDVLLHSHITRNIILKGCGIMSAAMDTVTEKELALAMAKMGGMGILHRNLSPEEQAAELSWVRRKIHYGGMVDSPISFAPDVYYSAFQRSLAAKNWPFTSFPVIDHNKKMLGLITRDQLEFVEGTNPTLGEIMLPIDKIVTIPVGCNSEDAYQLMKEKKVKKLPVVTKDGRLAGLYVWNDVKNDQRKREQFSLDDEGHFLVGAAIGVGEEDFKRASLLINAGAKVLVIDSSHGSCKPVKDQILRIKESFDEKCELIAGNIASYESAMYLLDGKFRPDALKVGIGPGSICTTRQVTGHGIPQVTALFEVWKAVQEYGKKTGYYVPIIADGGIRTSGDIVKCIASGANGIMLGSMMAGTVESPGAVVIKDGRKYKTIRGMGSRAAMEARSGSRGRYYRQEGEQHVTEELTSQQAEKMVPEGVEGLVQFKGTVERIMLQLLGGVQAGLAHTGAKDIPTFQNRAKLWVQSFAGVAEGKPHDISDIRD
eukprot:CAMPEP_0175144476 /NCGR_PEP_ID=MMETSP0087-20121206/14162_1 /TAXON_ID=136419 /ORGANISM="Unknown Unknown, Strain D1" /LENGTH=580 /DNA_ID=CAMNT_0016428967 /DNA_START=18 /DNA_END=1760 /DNA_ORIENTATION=-